MKIPHKILSFSDGFNGNHARCCFTLLMLLTFFLGCSTTGHDRSSRTVASAESQKDAVSALQSVAGAMTGKPLTQAEIKNLAKDLHQDKEAQSAVRAITDSMNSSESGTRYCPVDGERYSPKFKMCPVHGVPLKEVE